MRAEPLHTGNVARATQLLNKTNQMNLRTRRLTESELTAWSQTDGQQTWASRCRTASATPGSPAS